MADFNAPGPFAAVAHPRFPTIYWPSALDASLLSGPPLPPSARAGAWSDGARHVSRTGGSPASGAPGEARPRFVIREVEVLGPLEQPPPDLVPGVRVDLIDDRPPEHLLPERPVRGDGG